MTPSERPAQRQGSAVYWRFPLTGSTWVQVSVFDGAPTPEDVDYLIEYLLLTKKAMTGPALAVAGIAAMDRTGDEET